MIIENLTVSSIEELEDGIRKSFTREFTLEQLADALGTIACYYITNAEQLTNVDMDDVIGDMLKCMGFNLVGITARPR